MVTKDTTWAERLNGALDEISRLRRDRNDALDLITRACRETPALDDNPLILEARLVLL